MLNIGTRVRWTDSTIEGTVTRLDEELFSVHWDHQDARTDLHYPYVTLVKRQADAHCIEIIPPAPVAAPAVPADAMRSDSRYAMAVGAMEYRLADVYDAILRAIAKNDGDHVSSVQWNLDWIKDRIEDTADRVACYGTPDDGTPLSYLRDHIYANRK